MSTLKKVLFLNHNVRGEGTYLRCFNLARELVSRGIKVDISCTNPSKGLRRIQLSNPLDNLRLLLLPEIAKTPSYLGCALRTAFNCGLILQGKDRYDLIHAFATAIPSTGIPAIIAGRQGPLFLDWDDLWGGGLGTHLSSRANRLLKYLEKTVPLKARAIGFTTVSRELENRLLSAGFDPSTVKLIDNGAPHPPAHNLSRRKCREKLGLPQNEQILVSMGRMFDQSLELLLATFEKIKKAKPRTHLYVVGNLCRYGDLGRLTDRARARWGKIEGIVFTGGKQNPELGWWLTAADALILPLNDSPSDRARFPMRFGDYLISGSPSIVSEVGEVGRICRETKCALTAKAGSASDLALKTIQLLDQPELADFLVAKAFKTARGPLSWSQKGDALLDFYLERLTISS